MSEVEREAWRVHHEMTHPDGPTVCVCGTGPSMVERERARAIVKARHDAEMERLARWPS